MSALSDTTLKSPVRRSSLGANISALYALQAANYLIPLLSLPYLIRVLGPEQYGIMAMAYATVYFFVLFIDAGFNTRAVRLLSRADIRHEDINQIYATTQWLKFLLALVALTTLLWLVNAVPYFQAHSSVYLASFGIVIGSLLFPTWLFQGLQIMHYTTACSVAGRVLATAGIFVFVHEPNDVLLAALLQSSATVLSGVLSLPVLKHRLRLTVFMPFKKLVVSLQQTLRDGWELGVSEYIINATSNAGVFILGLFATESVVGIFAAILKIGQAGVNAFQPLLKSLFPVVTRRWSAGERDAKRFAHRWIQRVAIGALIFATALFAASAEVLSGLFGSEWAAYEQLLQGLAVWLFLSICASAIGQFGLLARGHKTRYARCLLLTGILQVSACALGAFCFGVAGVVGALIFSELARLSLFSLALLVHQTESSL